MTLKQLREDPDSDFDEHWFKLELCDCSHKRFYHWKNDKVKGWYDDADESSEIGIGRCVAPIRNNGLCKCKGFSSLSNFINDVRLLNK